MENMISLSTSPRPTFYVQTEWEIEKVRNAIMGEALILEEMEVKKRRKLFGEG